MKYLLFNVSRFDLEALGGVIATAKLEHRKLPGRSARFGDSVKHEVCEFGGVQVFRGWYTYPVWITGYFPKNAWHFAWRRESDTEVSLNQKITPKTGIRSYSPNSEVSYAADAPQGWTTFTLPEERLRRYFRELHDRDLELPTSGISQTLLEAASYREYVAMEDAIVKLCAEHSLLGDRGEIEFERLVADIYIRKLALLLGNFEQPRNLRLQPASEYLALREMHKATKAWLAKPTGALSPSLLMGVNTRVLQRATNRAYGVSPARWMKIVVLNSIYQALYRRRVSSVAAARAHYFISQRSRFNQEYKNLFGESPVDTLNRGKRLHMNRFNPSLHVGQAAT